MTEYLMKQRVVGVQEFASRLQSGLTPNFARWADFVAGARSS